MAGEKEAAGDVEAGVPAPRGLRIDSTCALSKAVVARLT
jgi:hypothetical protein